MEITSETSKMLVQEHKNILKVVDRLEQESNKIYSGGELDKDLLKKIIDFIKNYADKFHHAKEEDILFKELCKPEVDKNMHCNPVEQMLHEHEIGRDSVKKIEQGLEEEDNSKIIQGIASYISFIRDHIFKEDNILYPMADQALDKETQRIILNKFKEIEKRREVENQKYLAFIKSL